LTATLASCGTWPHSRPLTSYVIDIASAHPSQGFPSPPQTAINTTCTCTCTSTSTTLLQKTFIYKGLRCAKVTKLHR
jgi:hypothetical protein